MSRVFRRRRDGTEVRDLPALRRITPYLLRTRTGSAVYFPQRIEVDRLLVWLEETNAGRPADQRITLFHVILTAIARTLRLRPDVNRFIAGRRTYQHKEISVSFIVKAELSDDAPETEVRIVFTGRETIEQVRDLVNGAVGGKRGSERGDDDRLTDFFASWPRPALEGVARLVATLDYHNVLPALLMDAIPLYTSAYVVNAGSIGIDPPFHHLYEYGSASVFVAIGAVHKEAVVDDQGRVVARDCLNAVHTLDERASDGFYFARTAEVFRRLVANPQLLAAEDPSVDEILSGWPHSNG
ncbi:2-oxo acid dehydrogenase subunit E2 [Nocardioides pelophilus]|uniref:2-oxo acid dehydrogenase subunit E2 n=1 Tax=Nocardioides pelophilus TaxID=2172019 RepID=UPI0015FF2A84|nr:2-oxo acid dehydrogenase subunit E2 [Nocardioides pelophilus]